MFKMHQTVYRIGTDVETIASHGNSNEAWSRKRDKFNTIVFVALHDHAAHVLPLGLTVLSEPTEVWQAFETFVSSQMFLPQEACRLIIELFKSIKYNAIYRCQWYEAHGRAWYLLAGHLQTYGSA